MIGLLLASPSLVSLAVAQESLVVEKSAARAIDTDRVARDFAEASKNKGEVTVWSFNERAKSALEAPAVPLFLPAEVVSDLAAGSEQSKGVLREKSASEADTRIMNFEDESFVVRDFGKYHITIQGTRKLFSDQGDKSKTTEFHQDYISEFEPTYAGGQINFRYAGADYLVEFECEDGKANCITADEAQRFVAGLAVCNADGQCIDNGTSLIRR